MTYQNLVKDLEKLKNPAKAEIFKRFFKTGKGEYGEGDVFFGLTVPQTRAVVKKYLQLPFIEIQKLLNNKVHECRWVASMILCEKYNKTKKNVILSKAKDPSRNRTVDEIADFYLKNAGKFNNWDLVDSTAPNILGDYLFDKNKAVLFKFAKSKNLWERRISIMSTFGFIRKNQFNDALKIAEILLNDEHDLIHKAVGWMLREIGKRDLKAEEKFLQKHYQKMPRTMLRYAIEKFPESKRKFFLTLT